MQKLNLKTSAVSVGCIDDSFSVDVNEVVPKNSTVRPISIKSAKATLGKISYRTKMFLIHHGMMSPFDASYDITD